MVAATLALIFEGRVPSSTAIAERAGVTQRTLFNQFGDMDSLVLEVGRRQGRRMVELAPRPDPSLPLPERAEQFTAALAVILEEAMHIRWAILRCGDPTALDLVAGAREWIRRLLLASFAPELEAVVAPRRHEVIDELEIALDPMTWRMRRTVQGHSCEEAQVRASDTVCAILRHAASG
jgi:AcrR family transcriptional regulator